MHSYWTRSNNVFFFGLAILSIASVLVNLSTTYVLPEAKPEINRLQVNEMRRFAPFRGQDKAIVSYNLDFDLQSVFNWNVKQLFVFLVAEYQSNSNDINQVVVYDQIIQEKANAKQNLQGIFNKYPLVDEKMELRDAEVNFKHMPDSYV
uniref:Signal peptidase complex subunit 3 n=1 Tax=Aplanochytrium stocchinoi TaxID=215587 RepID=A0A7S3V0X3_9STRA